MSQWAEVTVLISKTFAVEIEENETLEDAKGYALEQCMDNNVEVSESRLAKNDREADSIRRHADEELAL